MQQKNFFLFVPTGVRIPLVENHFTKVNTDFVIILKLARGGHQTQNLVHYLVALTRATGNMNTFMRINMQDIFRPVGGAFCFVRNPTRALLENLAHSLDTRPWAAS